MSCEYCRNSTANSCPNCANEVYLVKRKSAITGIVFFGLVFIIIFTMLAVICDYVHPCIKWGIAKEYVEGGWFSYPYWQERETCIQYNN